MIQKTFYLYFFALISISAIGIFGLNQISSMDPFISFSWGCLFFFSVMTLIIFAGSKKAANSSNKNDFTTALMGLTFLKMLLSAGIILAYNSLVQPESKFFLIPFFGLYVLFTSFEVVFLMQLGKA
jgi:hypothetical protein